MMLSTDGVSTSSGTAAASNGIADLCRVSRPVVRYDSEKHRALGAIRGPGSDTEHDALDSTNGKYSTYWLDRKD